MIDKSLVGLKRIENCYDEKLTEKLLLIIFKQMVTITFRQNCQVSSKDFLCRKIITMIDTEVMGK